MPSFLLPVCESLDAAFHEGCGEVNHLFKRDFAAVLHPLAVKYKKSPAQIILRWHVQEGFSTIPGARNPDYIKENIEVYNFKLSEDDMKKIRGLDKEKRFFTSTLAEIQHFKDWNPGD